MARLDMNAVTNFWSYFHDKVVSHPTLYVGKDRVDVVLPIELLDWSNAKAGHSGFASGARPVGIRRYCTNPVQYRDEIFFSPETLANFILTSECDGRDYSNKIRKRLAADGKLKQNKTYDLSAADAAPALWGNSIFIDLAKKFGKDTVIVARNNLTLGEFGLRFGLDMPEDAKLNKVVNTLPARQDSNKRFKRFGTK